MSKHAIDDARSASDGRLASENQPGNGTMPPTAASDGVTIEQVTF